MFESYRIIIAFTADRDGVPGWGNKPEDWVKLATANFTQQSHYNTSFEVLSTEQRKKPYIDGEGYKPVEFDKLNFEGDENFEYIQTIRDRLKAGNFGEELLRFEKLALAYESSRRVVAVYKHIHRAHNRQMDELLATLRETYGKPHATVEDLIPLIKQSAKDTEDLMKAEFGSDEDGE